MKKKTKKREILRSERRTRLATSFPYKNFSQWEKDAKDLGCKIHSTKVSGTTNMIYYAYLDDVSVGLFYSSDSTGHLGPAGEISRRATGTLVATREWPFARKMTKAESAQRERLEHKEAAKRREVVDCRIKFICRWSNDPMAIEFEFAVTREQLHQLQIAHASDKLMINWIREDKF